jgi:serine/threonine-protein kinase
VYCPRCGTQNPDKARYCRSCGLDQLATPAGDQLPVDDVSEVDLVRQELREEYDILEELGRGGMAVVFKARERQLEREVAIKVLPFSLAFDREFVERFQREARTSARLEHPNIIPIYRVGRAGRVIYFVMKFLRGKPLTSVLAARGTLPPGEIRRILIDVARALAYAHKSEIVHRDIKPDNIMFDEHGQAVVTDFGIAKAASGGKLTGTGMSIGTPHYMSPEQAKAQALDGRSDIYSLGVVAFQCLTGGVPFDGDDSFSIGYKHIMEELPTPRLETPEQWALFDLVRRMMAKTPIERFQNADELIQALEGGPVARTSADETLAISPVARERLSSAATTPLPKITTRGTGLRPPRREERSALGGLALFLLIVAGLAGGGFYAYKRGFIFATAAPPADSAGRLTGVDSSVAALADSLLRAESTTAPAPAPGPSTPLRPTAADSAAAAQVAPGTPGRVVLEGVPRGARVAVNGQPVRTNSPDLPPGTHRITVRAAGFQTWEQRIAVLPGATHTVPVELTPSSTASVDPCAEPGPSYNIDNLCFDSRPVPLSPTFVPIAADAPVMPRQSILFIKVSREGKTLEARVYVASNEPSFDLQALDLARTLQWNPAQKNGEPVSAWVQWRFQPVRQ